MPEKNSRKEIQNKTTPNSKLSQILIRVGLLAILLGFLFLIAAFNSFFFTQAKYYFFKPNEKAIILPKNLAEETTMKPQDYLIPTDRQFSLIIPKIGLNQPVEANIDPFSKKSIGSLSSYEATQTIGSVYPGQIGNVFILSNGKNSLFWLLPKLGIGDKFYFSYLGNIYQYEVKEKKIINPNEKEYLQKTSYDKQSILMTSWPFGSELKRYLIIGQLVMINP